MHWASLALDGKDWKVPLYMVMSLKVAYEAGNYVANGATITGVFEKKDFCNFKICSEVNL